MAIKIVNTRDDNFVVCCRLCGLDGDSNTIVAISKGHDLREGDKCFIGKLNERRKVEVILRLNVFDSAQRIDLAERLMWKVLSVKNRHFVYQTLRK